MRKTHKHFQEAEDKLYEALTKLKTMEEFKIFFKDLCTPTEIKALSDRWRVVCLLDKKDANSYREIYRETGVSITTIGRVARFLKEEAYGGYRLVLSRMRRNRK